MFVCLGLTSLWNIWGHITTVPACSSGTLTNVLPHRNAMPQTQDMASHPVTVYRHGADQSLCYPLMWNVTLEYTATHFNVLGETRPGNPSPTFHTHQRTLNLMLSSYQKKKLNDTFIWNFSFDRDKSEGDEEDDIGMVTVTVSLLPISIMYLGQTLQCFISDSIVL